MDERDRRMDERAENRVDLAVEATRDEVEHVWKTFKQSVNYFKSKL
ncbi:MAG: hypothetical protein V2I67_03130 [Thermoanaerobaculales bacterium]|jgi:hypothetical protein|nr:hypothetical protein [Thermoanaerobaculales bacterium]